MGHPHFCHKGSGTSAGWLAEGRRPLHRWLQVQRHTWLITKALQTARCAVCGCPRGERRDKHSSQYRERLGQSRESTGMEMTITHLYVLLAFFPLCLSFLYLSPFLLFISLLFFFSFFVSAGSLTNHLVGVAQSLTCVCGQHYPQRLRYYWL